MSNETQVKTEQNGALNKLKAEFGQVNLSDGNEQKKAAALSFSGGGLYIGLREKSHSIAAISFSMTASRTSSGTSPESNALFTVTTLMSMDDHAPFVSVGSLDQKIFIFSVSPMNPFSLSLFRESSRSLCSPSSKLILRSLWMNIGWIVSTNSGAVSHSMTFSE